MPHRSGVPLEWRLKKGRYDLIGSSCKECKELQFPGRTICNCGSETEEYMFSGKGTIVTYTIISSAPAGFEEYSPYVVAIIKLEEGPTISTQIVNSPEEIEVGKQVVSVFRKLNEDGSSGILYYGTKFEVLD